MLRTTILLMVAVCLTMTAHAHCNWTIKQCRAHYGKDYPAPNERNGLSEKWLFHTTIHGVKVDIYVDAFAEMYGGQVWRIQYVNTSGKPFPSTLELQLMQDNFPGLTWTPEGAPQLYVCGFNQQLDDGTWSHSSTLPAIEADEVDDTITIGWDKCPG
jgi:hypothetical protein